jgi:hypothetical protein
VRGVVFSPEQLRAMGDAYDTSVRSLGCFCKHEAVARCIVHLAEQGTADSDALAMATVKRFTRRYRQPQPGECHT